MAESNKPYVMRSASGVITFWVGATVLFVIVLITLIQAEWRVFAFLIAPSLLLAWLLWFVLYRPAIRYDNAGAVVANLGRVYILPWGHVTSVRQGIGIVFTLDAGKPVQAVGVPARRQRGIISGAIDRRTRPSNDINYNADILEGARGAAPASPDPVVARWDVIPLLVGALLVIAVVLEFIIRI